MHLSTSHAAMALMLTVGLSTAAGAGEASADTDPSTIVVTATRSPVAIIDAPATVSVIDDEQIADQLATDIRDLVRYEPGVTVRRAPARFNAALSAVGRAGNEGFNIRGIGGNRVLIQVDGVRIPYGFSFGAQDVGRGDYVDIGLVQSVEILRGPASALYGSDGLAGVVSFITADPVHFLDEGNVGGLIRSQYNSADQEFTETAIVAGRSGALSAMVAYTRRDWQELENQGTVGGLGPNRTQPNPQDGQSNATLGRIVWDAGNGHRLRLTGEYLDTRLFTEGLTGRSASVELLAARDTGQRWRTALDWSWTGDSWLSLVRAAIYVQDAGDVQFTDEDRTPLPDRERLNSFENRVWGGSFEARSDFATGPISHRMIAGADFNETRQQGVRDGTVPPPGEIFPTRAFPVTTFQQLGLFIGDELRWGPLSIFPALRFDHYRLTPQADPLAAGFATTRQADGRVSPKIGFVLTIADEVRLFGSYGEGFKAPEPTQINQFFQNLAFGYVSRPNPDLGPERSRGIEGGVRIGDSRINLALTAFSMDYTDFISQEVVGGNFTSADPAVFQFVNLSSASVEGAEARLQLAARNGLTGNVAISYATGDATNAAGTRLPLASVDPLRVVAGVGYRDPARRFGGDLVMTHHARKEANSANGLCSGGCFLPESATVLDITAWLRIVDAVTLRVGIFNITDERYALWSDVRGLAASTTIADAYTQPGRNASVSLSFRF